MCAALVHKPKTKLTLISVTRACITRATTPRLRVASSKGPGPGAHTVVQRDDVKPLVTLEHPVGSTLQRSNALRVHQHTSLSGVDRADMRCVRRLGQRSVQGAGCGSPWAVRGPRAMHATFARGRAYDGYCTPYFLGPRKKILLFLVVMLPRRVTRLACHK